MPSERSLRRIFAGVVPRPGPERTLAHLTFFQALGMGLFLTSGAIFFVRAVGLSISQVGWGLSAAGLFGILGTVPLGRLSDRVGRRPLLASLYGVLAVLFVGYGFVTTFWQFLVLASLISAAETSISPLRSALIHDVCAPEDRVRVRAQMRSVLNLGFGLGAILAMAPLADGTLTAFRAVTAGYAVVLLAAMVLVLTLRPGGAGAATTSKRDATSGLDVPALDADRGSPALRNPAFLSLTVVNGLLELHHTIITIGIPLWIVTHTNAPRILASVLVALDTAVVVVFQVPVARRATDADSAARLLATSGLLLAFASLIFAVSGGDSEALAVLALTVGTVVLTWGEMMQSGAGFALSFDLAPQGREGEYQGAFALGRGLQQAAGPALVTMLAARMGSPGWVVLAALFVLLGSTVRPLTVMASRPAATLAYGESQPPPSTLSR